MGKAKLFLGLLAVLMGLVFLPTLLPKTAGSPKPYGQGRAIAARLLLTDFCFSTESRHTRHIALPELVAPFQDLPGFHDHFPSSSFYRPQPERLAPGFQSNSTD